jgi:Zn-dependent protease
MMIILPGGIVFGWAKPVPINPYNFKDQKWGSLKVAIAGPTVNLLIAVIFGLLIRVFNLPTDLPFVSFLSIIIFYNLLLALFNLIPIPPLDGHWILFTFLSDYFDEIKTFLKQYGIFIIIFLIFFGGLNWVNVVLNYLFQLITGINY